MPEDAPAVIQLERVVIHGERANPQAVAGVQQLPRVVIVGRRAASAQTAQATQVASACTAQALC